MISKTFTDELEANYFSSQLSGTLPRGYKAAVELSSEGTYDVLVFGRAPFRNVSPSVKAAISAFVEGYDSGISYRHDADEEPAEIEVCPVLQNVL